MKKKIILLASLVFTGIALNAQVGVGTDAPKTTLEVVGETTATVADGVLVPRFTVTQLAAKDAAYGAAQNGALVFVTSGTGTAGKTSEITDAGFHYYDSTTSKWKAIGGAATATISHNTFTRSGASYSAVLASDLSQMFNTLHLTTSSPGILTLPNLTDADAGKVLYIFSTAGANTQINFTQADGTSASNNLISTRGVTFISMGAAGWVRGSY